MSRGAFVAIAIGLAGCPWIDPGSRRFPCESDADCATGWRCADDARGRACTGGPADPVDAGEVDDPDAGTIVKDTTPLENDACGITRRGWRMKFDFDDGWAVQLGTGETDEVLAATLVADGLVFGGRIDATGPLFSGDAFVAKVGFDGAFHWCERLSTPDYDAVNGLAIDSQGRIWIVGLTRGALAGALAEEDPGDAFVARYAAGGGEAQLVRQYDFTIGSTPAFDSFQSIAIRADEADEVFVLVQTDGAASGAPPFRGATMTAELLRLSEDGGVTSLTQVGAPQASVRPRGLMHDGTRLLFGAFSTMAFDDGEVGTGNAGWLGLGRVHPDSGTFTGRSRELRHPFSSIVVEVDGLATSADGDVLVVARSEGTIAGEPLGAVDLQLVAFDVLGAPRWVRQFGSSKSESSSAVARCGEEWCVAGATFGKVDGTPGDTDGWTTDAFVARFAADGTPGPVRQLPGDSSEEVRVLLVNDAGEQFLLGSTDRWDSIDDRFGDDDLWIRMLVP